MKQNLTYEKAFAFSKRIVNLYKYLSDKKNEYVLSKQILRSGTSIGANIKEGLEAQSKRDFLNKMNIALKEASETEYWLELLIATKYIDATASRIILAECKELNKILNTIVKTTKKNLRILDN
ncbi:four helix bundle protein [Clostridium cochlearium]|uniref:four helix bundle protein n=1 Tax=Clostridium cochlearium TaxID=1494 RepID=UPI001EDFA99A|nr:four helix bundle protein [Clostridium cochlearium]MBV1820131.1 four helix bundle protein [Bacteroidales bacterium MSK.15.36]MCG4571622.1 four helix bundle protein [Clostridium cochlearium]MCG4580684.1 four helix bundle protein [Clostridium cochlearium]